MAPASSASSSQPPRPLSPTEDDSRPRLTEEERKRNHIKSEQKRRAALRVRFEKLTTIVPDTEGQARSEGLVLNKTLDHIVDLMNDRRKMVQTLEARGISVDSKYKA
ncbi:hypothetical protein N0V88_004446 [Collariella sp. IMI 366227]|nr:hypothetical protein N0V88_004446 [Collariella sp. IMI 366227]